MYLCTIAGVRVYVCKSLNIRYMYFGNKLLVRYGSDIHRELISYLHRNR